MAKKKAARGKAQASPMLTRIQGGVKTMQREAEAVLSRARKEAMRLSRDQQRGFDGVVKEAQRLRGDFEKMVKRASKDLEARPKQLLAMLEKEAEKRLEPIVKRLLGPSRQELQRLSKRVSDLEQFVKDHSHEEAPVMHAVPPALPSDVISPSSGD